MRSGIIIKQLSLQLRHGFLQLLLLGQVRVNDVHQPMQMDTRLSTFSPDGKHSRRTSGRFTNYKGAAFL
jgi:hypothetical protein